MQIQASSPEMKAFVQNLKFDKPLRAVCCKNRLRVCKIEKSDSLKICQNKGFGEVVLKI